MEYSVQQYHQRHYHRGDQRLEPVRGADGKLCQQFYILRRFLFHSVLRGRYAGQAV